MTARRIELLSAFIAFVLGMLWIVPLAHDFRLVASGTSALTFTGQAVDLSPPIGWAGVTLYCIGAAIAICAVPVGACLHLWRDRLGGFRVLMLATGVLVVAVLFYALAPNQFWLPQVLAIAPDHGYVVIATLTLIAAVTATAAALAELWLPDPQFLPARKPEPLSAAEIQPGNPRPNPAR